MDAVDVKDLQYTIVKSRREAVTLITDIYTAEAKSVIKTLKEIETRPINAELSYKPINLQKISSGQIPMQPREDKVFEQISGIRGVLKVVKGPANNYL